MVDSFIIVLLLLVVVVVMVLLLVTIVYVRGSKKAKECESNNANANAYAYTSIFVYPLTIIMSGHTSWCCVIVMVGGFSSTVIIVVVIWKKETSSRRKCSRRWSDARTTERSSCPKKARLFGARSHWVYENHVVVTEDTVVLTGTADLLLFFVQNLELVELLMNRTWPPEKAYLRKWGSDTDCQFAK